MFDSRRAQRVIQFVENLKHTKGEFHGKNFALLPWQEKIISDVFGTMRDDRPDVRQYTSAYIEIPKKQGKQLALYTKIATPVYTTTEYFINGNGREWAEIDGFG